MSLHLKWEGEVLSWDFNKNLDKNFHYLFKYLHENSNKNLNHISTKKMDAKESKTNETPASLQLGLVELNKWL